MKLRKSVAVFVSLALLLAMVPLVLTAAKPAPNPTVEWKQIVGNRASGIPGPGPTISASWAWSTKGGKAKLDLVTGALKFEVKGLAAAQGSAIGTPDNVTTIDVVLVCDIDGSGGQGTKMYVLVSGLAVSAQGDAKVPKGTIAACCPIPDPWKSELDKALLIIAPGFVPPKHVAHGAVRIP